MAHIVCHDTGTANVLQIDMEQDDERYQRFNLRIPRDLHAKLAEASATNSRSVNAEIIGRLEQSFAEDIETRVRRLEEAISKIGKRR